MFKSVVVAVVLATIISVGHVRAGTPSPEEGDWFANTVSWCKSKVQDAVCSSTVIAQAATVMQTSSETVQGLNVTVTRQHEEVMRKLDVVDGKLEECNAVRHAEMQILHKGLQALDASCLQQAVGMLGQLDRANEMAANATKMAQNATDERRLSEIRLENKYNEWKANHTLRTGERFTAEQSLVFAMCIVATRIGFFHGAAVAWNYVLFRIYLEVQFVYGAIAWPLLGVVFVHSIRFLGVALQVPHVR